MSGVCLYPHGVQGHGGPFWASVSLGPVVPGTITPTPERNAPPMQMDLPGRCWAPITPTHPEADDSPYYTRCARPEGHTPNTCTSQAVLDRKEANRKAREQH